VKSRTVVVQRDSLIQLAEALAETAKICAKALPPEIAAQVAGCFAEIQKGVAGMIPEDKPLN